MSSASANDRSLQDLGRGPTQAIVHLGFRAVDADHRGVEIIHRARYQSLTALQKRWLKRRQATEPMIGHAKSGNRMDRCWLQGAIGDALHALSWAAGYHIRGLLRAIARLGTKLGFLRRLIAPIALTASVRSSFTSRLTARVRLVAGRMASSTSTPLATSA